MPDRRDKPFSATAAGPSSGQSFRRFGQVGRKSRSVDDAAGQFEDVADELDMMSARFRVLGKAVAEDALEIMRDNILKYITEGAGSFHGYSMGRLAATIGRYDPTQFKSSDAAAASEQEALEWAAANAPNYVTDTGEELTISEFGAYSSVKRSRGSEWSAEVGTFTPYAGLVEDGGSMPIHPYRNPNLIHIATWEANHMFKKGAFDSAADLEDDIVGKVNDIMHQ